jgi:hypothetical protein
MASPYRALIDMLYITSSEALSMRQQDNQDFIKNTLSKNRLNFKTVNSKNIVNTITDNIIENNIDMLVMVNNRHTFLEDILIQSTIDKMSLFINIPFLVLQNINRDTL